ncbi:MAG: ABC transporter substrate-binding protein [Gammaproteobacteria bacterium]|nr:ABC transporter substrate-binding protein [Gammaproteobacteria bacterium]
MIKQARNVAVAALVGLLSFGSASIAAESPDPIKLAINEWTGQHITTHVAGEILKRMGYNVEYVTAGYYPQMTALQDNTVTATLEIWSSNIGENWDKALESGKVEVLGSLGLKPREAWFYPSYVKEKCPGLPSWEALNECAEIFATADTFPKGRFVDYPADWGTTNVDRINALDMNFASVPAGSEGALIAEIKGAVARQEPLVVMFWAPHWLHAVVDMEIVELPSYESACYEDASWGKNPSATYDCDWDDSAHIDKVAWIGMKDKWPEAYNFLKNYKLSNADQEKMMNEIDVEGKDLDAVVNAWLDANESAWKPMTQ